MKLIYIVIDGMSDRPIVELNNKTPLEAANTPNLDALAKEGTTGLMYTVKKTIAPESDVAVLSILGYDPFQYPVSRGVLEAIGAGLPIKTGDLALRCNFATLGPQRSIIDRRVGRTLTTEEATVLAKAINQQIDLSSPPTKFVFKNTTGHRGVLVLNSDNQVFSSEISNTDPAYMQINGIGVVDPKAQMLLKECVPLNHTDEAKISAKLVNEFTLKTNAILDQHKINKQRKTSGKLKANVILARDAGNTLPKIPKLNERFHHSFVCLADMPAERGISKLAGMSVVDIPPPTKNLEKDYEVRVKKLLSILDSYDCFYIHLKGPDEPGHDGNFNLKRQMIATTDKHFIGKLLQEINLKDHVLCVTSDHSTPCELKAHSDDPVPLLISGNNIEADQVQSFSEKTCRNGDLGLLWRGTELMPKLIAFIT